MGSVWPLGLLYLKLLQWLWKRVVKNWKCGISSISRTFCGSEKEHFLYKSWAYFWADYDKIRLISFLKSIFRLLPSDSLFLAYFFTIWDKDVRCQVWLPLKKMRKGIIFETFISQNCLTDCEGLEIKTFWKAFPYFILFLFLCLPFFQKWCTI